MRLFRFCRHAADSYFGLLGSLPEFVRLAWVPMTASIAGAGLSHFSGWAGETVDALSLAVFSVTWLRFVAMSELPEGQGHFRLGRREIFFTVFWMVTQAFVVFPAGLLASALSLATGTDAQTLVVPLLAAAHALLGGFYLLPVELALEDAGGPGWPVPNMILQGGIAVGLGLLLVWGPSEAVVAAARALGPSGEGGLQGALLAHVVTVVPRYLGAALVCGYLGLAFRSLLAEAR